MCILEGLVFDGVLFGCYELIVFFFKIVGVDVSLVCVIFWEIL